MNDLPPSYVKEGGRSGESAQGPPESSPEAVVVAAGQMPAKRQNKKRERWPADAEDGGAAQQVKAEVDAEEVTLATTGMPATKPSPVTMPVVSVAIDPPEVDEEEDEQEHDEDEDALGMPGECSSTRVFFATIQADGRPVGTVKAMAIARPNMRGGFYRACDAESAGLEAIGSVLFDHNGLPRYPPLQKEDAHGYQAAGYLRFLYIEHFEISSTPDDLSEERRSELGAAAIRSLLTLPELEFRWSVAGYICDGFPHPSNRWYGEDSKQKPSPVVIRQRMANDARQFLCAGFREVEEDGRRGMLYITEDMLQAPPLSQAEAREMPLMLAKGPGDSERW